MWEETLSLLSTSGWRCIAFDHRGSGESPVEPELITVQNMVDDIIGVMDQLAIETCVLAGESSGAAIAQLAATQYPHRITGLIVVDSASTDRAEPEQAARLIEIWQDTDVPLIDKTKIMQPTLIIHGTKDVIVPIESSRALKDLIPNSDLVELNGCGHVPTMTRPREVYEAILKYFL